MRHLIDILEQHGVSITLDDLCEIKTNFPEADFWLVRKGTDETVGTPVKEYSPEHIGIKVVKTDILLPQYLFYVMKNIHNQRYWVSRTVGTLRLVHIRTADVANLRVG